jgi:uncharacterized membrane protein
VTYEATNQVSVLITAPPATVWRELMDVERWPQWTRSMSKVDKLDDGDLAPGHRVRIRQPRMPSIVWTVTAVEPGRRFEWSSTVAGVTTRASHQIQPQPDRQVLVTLVVRQSGRLAPVVHLLTGGRTQRYIEMEAAGLRTTSEARAQEADQTARRRS